MDYLIDLPRPRSQRTSAHMNGVGAMSASIGSRPHIDSPSSAFFFHALGKQSSVIHP